MLKKIAPHTLHDFLERKIMNYNVNYVSDLTGSKSGEKICYVYEDNSEYLAGISFECYWGIMHINYLWVDQTLRGEKIGEQLLSIANQVAKDTKCRIIHLETFSFQAPEFYKKYGFIEFAKLENIPEEGINLHFMQKNL